MYDLLMPFQFGFMQNAFWVVLLLAPPTAMLSCFLVLKGWSLMGDAVSHAVLPGVIIAYLLNIPLLIGAFCAGMTCALATGYLKDNSRVKQDTVMGVVFSGMFGFGMVLYTKVDTNVHLDHILFGNMLGVGAEDLWTAGLVGAFVTLTLAVKWKDLLLHAFDPAQARAIGLPVGVLHYGLLSILSLTIVATLKSVGLILAIGLLISPGAIAFLLTRQFLPMMLIAILTTLVAMFGGVYLSFWIDSSPAPTIILFLTGLFILAFSWRQMQNKRSDRIQAA
ncbi:metal ABC transporter permease [Roseibium algae]|uniref:Metal ABC transporter permease n=1 Tax=Roseibium algae TaxID=3123038 RepID=A0ABU8TGN3_9HYPH